MAVSAGLPLMLHGVAVLQMITLVMGAADVGPKLGTGSGPVIAVGLAMALGVGLAEVFAVGDAFAVPGDAAPRPRRTMTPTLPNSRSTITAMIAGISHGGRSMGPRSTGRRGTVDGLRAGTRMGVGGTMTGAGEVLGGDGAAGENEDDGLASVPPGDHSGAATGDQVGCSGAFVSAAGGAGGSGGAGAHSAGLGGAGVRSAGLGGAGVHSAGLGGAGAAGLGAGGAGAGGFVALASPSGIASKGDDGTARAAGSHRAGAGGS